MTAAQPFDVGRLAEYHGGTWCDCIDAVIEDLTAKKLAVYCIEKGFPVQKEPYRDEMGDRYAYKLFTVTETVPASEGQDKPEQRDRVITASFGDYDHRPVETFNSILQAIREIARLEKRMPQRIAEDVLKCDETKAPSVQNMTTDTFAEAAAQEQPQANTHRRYRQTAEGMNIRIR